MSVRLNVTLDTGKLNRLLSKMNLSKNKEVKKALAIISYKIEGDAKESIQTNIKKPVADSKIILSKGDLLVSVMLI